VFEATVAAIFAAMRCAAGQRFGEVQRLLRGNLWRQRRPACWSRAAERMAVAIEQRRQQYHGTVDARGCSLRYSIQQFEDRLVLYWALVFLIIAIVAGIFGFGGVAAAAAGIAKVLFFLFVVIFLIALLFGFSRRRPPVV
jgi:uncharacterized membrane protein YtjA (UPF0391 family)